MSKALRLSSAVAGLLALMAGLLSCGGSGAAPFNGATALPAVSVAVSPPTMTVTTGTTQSFTATVYNSNVSGVQWLVNGFPGGGGNIGTVDSSGNYTAPQYVPNPAVVTVSAVANADNTKSGSAQVTITGTPIPAQVSISPTVAAVNVGTTLNLTATVTGPADTAVIWQVVDNGNGVVNGDANVGTIVPGPNGATAVYTAPAKIPSSGTVTIKAVSHSQPSVFASCVVTIADIQSVTLSSGGKTVTTASVQVGTSFPFTANVVGAGNISVVWEVNGIPGGNATIGTITASGPNNSIGTYTAPSTVPTTGSAISTVPTGSTVTVTAVSALLPTKFASATVTIVPVSQNVSISISPTAAPVNLGGTLPLTATVTGSSDTSVIWEVVDNGKDVVNGDATVGTIAPGANSANATYTAPAKAPNSGTVTILAVSHAQPNVSASCVVTFTNISGVTISPTTANVQVGTRFVFTATVTGTGDTSVIWEVNSIAGGNATDGTIAASGTNNTTGTYTAPSAVPISGNTVTVTAVSHALPSKFASAIVTILPASQNSVSISISPISATVLTNGTEQFTATVLHTTNTAVTWQVNGVPGGNSTYGTITPVPGTNSANYVAPSTVPAQNPVIVSAIPNAAPNISATASVTVSGTATVTISPVTATVGTGTAFQFTASVSGPGVTNTSVFWEVNGIQGGNSTVGKITGSNNVGTYTAPASVPAPNVVTVTAVSFAQPSRSASAQVTITQSAVTAQISPISATVLTNGTQQFTVNVLHTTNTAVTWQVNGVPGGNSTYGTITPTGTDSATYVAPSTVPAQNPVIVSAIPNAAPNFTATASVTITGVATVTISPLTVSVNAGTTTQFTATVTGTAITDTSVFWQVNGVTGGSTFYGTIAGSTNNTAVYSAPAKQPAPPGNVVTVTAVSNAQTNRSASATVTITPPVANGVTIQVTGLTELSLCAQTEYTATIGNATNTSVMAWQVNGVTGGNSTYGTITAMAGNSDIATYVPPQQLPTPPTVVIGAIPTAAPNEVGTVDVTLTNPPIQVNVVDTQNNSSTAQVGVGLTVPLQATVTNSCTIQTATWYVGQNGDFIEGGNSTLGTIAPDSQANQVTYTAPATVPSNPTVTIEATSDAVPSIFGTATITINPAPVITVSITPSTPQTVDFQGSTGNANVEYFATIAGTNSTDVTWEVNGYPGGDTTCQNGGVPCGIGTIGTDPANPGNPLQALYTAPVAVPSPPTVNVTAVFAGPPQVVSNSDPVTIVTPPPPPPTIAIVPASIFPIIPGQTLSPQADIGCPGGGCNNVVDWSLSLPSGEGGSCTALTPCGSLSLATGPCPGGNSLECQNTNNSPNLVYSSPTSIPSDPWDVTLTAILDSDQSVQATATIEITASATASISISPTNPTIQAGSDGSITFTATIINAPAGTNVTWSLQCNSLAPSSGEWCYDFSGDGGGPGCLDVNEKFCFTNSQEALPTKPATYSPPAALGSQFQTNVCTQTQGTNGMVPLIASITAGNCNTTSCTAQACITVTPP